MMISSHNGIKLPVLLASMAFSLAVNAIAPKKPQDNILSITSSATGALCQGSGKNLAICTISLLAGGPAKSITLSNNSPIVIVKNLRPVLTGTALDGNVTVSPSSCESVLPGQSCIFTFTPQNTPVALTDFSFTGINANPVLARMEILAVGNIPLSVIGVDSFNLYTNDPSTTALMVIRNDHPFGVASNISADIASTALNNRVNQDASDCVTLPAGQTCTLRFSLSNTPADTALTNFDVLGSNTQTVNGEMQLSTIEIEGIPNVGDASFGGIVACESFPNNERRIFINTVDTVLPWGASNGSFGATSTSDGLTNTQNIVAALTVAPYNYPLSSFAAGYCTDYNIDQNGNSPCVTGSCYGGWYLATQGEFGCFFGNLAFLPVFQNGRYWMSLADSVIQTEAGTIEFPGGFFANFARTEEYFVKCARYLQFVG